MQVHQTDFSTGSVRRNILEVAVPLTAAQLLNLLYNIVDRIYIGMIPESGPLLPDHHDGDGLYQSVRGRLASVRHRPGRGR